MNATQPLTHEELLQERGETWDQRQAAGGWDYTGPASDTVPAADLAARLMTTTQLGELPPPAWLIDGLLPEGGLSIMYGPPGSGKSFLAVSMALCLSAGVDFLGHLVKNRTRTLYIVGEGVRGIGRRVEAWKQHHGQVDDDVGWLDGAVNLANHLQIDALGALIESESAGLVVVDTFARCTVGVEENSAKEVGQVIANIDRLRRRTGCTMLIVHHSGKDITRGSRGASSLKGAADAELEVAAGRLAVAKMKDSTEESPTPFTLEPTAGSVVPITSKGIGAGLTRQAAEALEALRGACVTDGHTIASGEWRDAAGLSQTTFYRSRTELLETSQVTQSGIGRAARYRPAEPVQVELGEEF